MGPQGSGAASELGNHQADGMVGRDHVHRVGLDELHLRALRCATICCLCRPQSRSHQFPSSVARLHRMRFAPCRCAASTRSTSTLAAVAGSSAAIACWFTRLVCAPPGRVSCTGNQGFWPVLATPSKISSPAAGWGATSQCMVANCWMPTAAARGVDDIWQVRRRRLAAIAAAIAIAGLSNPPCRAPSPPSPFPTSPATAALAASCKQRREGAARESGPSERREAVVRGSGTMQRREAHLQCQRCGWACLHVRRFSSKTALSALKTQKFSRQQAHVTGPDE